MTPQKRHCGEPKLRAEGAAGSEAILCVAGMDCRGRCGGLAMTVLKKAAPR